MISQRCGAVVESHVPGRVRFRLPRDQRREDVLSEIESIFRSVEGIVNITSNVATGSVLVQHNPDQVKGGALIDIARGARIISDVDYDLQSLESAHWPEKSEAAISVLKQMKKFDTTLNRLTRGTVDGKMVVIFALVGCR